MLTLSNMTGLPVSICNVNSNTANRRILLCPLMSSDVAEAVSRTTAQAKVNTKGNKQVYDKDIAVAPDERAFIPYSKD